MQALTSRGCKSIWRRFGRASSWEPRWRSFLSTLNWRRDPDYEQRMKRLRRETEQIKIESELIRKETEQLNRDNVRLRQLNARGRELLFSAEQLCSLPDTNSTPPRPTAPD